MAAATAAGQRGVALSNRFPGIYQTQKTLLFQSAVWVLWVETEVPAMSEYVYSQSGLKDIVLPLLQKYPVEQAILFSSYARDESTASSDINLVIVDGAAFDPTDVFCIADELYASTGKTVGVYELRRINAGADFYHTILDEGVQIA